MLNCFSCGFPMRTAEDYPKGNTEMKYCIHCADENGMLKSFEDKIDDMTDFIVKANSIDPVTARMAAKEVLMRMPAWANQR